MTNNQYGNYQTPSSRPPEPPYRADSQQGSQVGAAGFTEPIVQPEHGANRLGEPGAFPEGAGDFDRKAPATSPAAFGPAPAGAPAAPAAPDDGFRAGDTGAMPNGSAGAYAASQARSYEARPVQHAAPKARAEKKQGGGGKTFLFGFLGALVACALALGGFAIYNGGNAPSVSTRATTLGSSDPSVINAVEEGQTLAEAVAAKALPSVVAVYNYQNATTSGYGFGYNTSTGMSAAADTDGMTASGMGSGVVISADGYILTNYHVVEDADKLTVKVGDDERDAAYVGGDESSDVAVIKVEDTTGLEPADIGDSDSLVIGEWVMTIGAPLGLEQSVATGVVSATNRSTIMSDSDSTDLYSYYYGTSNTDYTYYPNMIQTDAVINPGNSGGALVDSDGKLIGINTMISSYSGDYAGVGFAIPVNYAMGIAEQIIDGKEPTHAMLGVSISSVNASNAQRYGLSSTTGAYISSIAEGTGAADSDLQVGDIITQVDDSKIESTTDVTLEVREHNPGDTVTVTVNRNGETVEVPVTLSSDENLTKSSGNSGNSNGGGSNGGNGYGQGNGNSNGRGNSNGYDSDQLEELLRMLGM